MNLRRYPCHTAALDQLTGLGLLAMPRPEDDLDAFAGPTLHHAAWDAVVRDLLLVGWEPDEDVDGGWMHAGETADGRGVLYLRAHDPIASRSDLEALTDAEDGLWELLRSGDPR